MGYWSFLKKKCLYNQFYGDSESFCVAIDDGMANGYNEYREELKTLMTLKFQSFQNVQFLTVGSIENQERWAHAHRQCPSNFIHYTSQIFTASRND